MIGYGSAGARHAKLLRELGLQVAVNSRRPVADYPAYQALAEALDREAPGYVVVANETARHLETLGSLAQNDYRGVVMVEKPLAAANHGLPAHRFAKLYVGYQLRFHPVVIRLRQLLEETQAIAVQAYVGQHLSSWRPDRPYTESYSSRVEAGGGALRDLSHEIDLLLWLFGAWSRMAALGGNHGALDISSDDAYGILMETRDCPIVTLQLNYLDHAGRRDILVCGAKHTLHADLLRGAVTIDGAEERLTGDIDEARRAMHCAALSGEDGDLCSASEGLAVVRAIEAAEAAAAQGAWAAA